MAAKPKAMSIRQLKAQLAQKDETIAELEQTKDELLSEARMNSRSSSVSSETDRLAASFRRRHGGLSARSSGIY